MVPKDPEVTRATDINTDPQQRQNHRHRHGPQQLGPGDTMAVGGSTDTKISMALVVAQPLNTNKATDCGPYPGLPCAFWWQHGPQTSKEIPATVGPWVQT